MRFWRRTGGLLLKTAPFLARFCRRVIYGLLNELIQFFRVVKSISANPYPCFIVPDVDDRGMFTLEGYSPGQRHCNFIDLRLGACDECPARFRAKHRSPCLKPLGGVILRVEADGDQIDVPAQTLTQ